MLVDKITEQHKLWQPTLSIRVKQCCRFLFRPACGTSCDMEQFELGSYLVTGVPDQVGVLLTPWGWPARSVAHSGEFLSPARPACGQCRMLTTAAVVTSLCSANMKLLRVLCNALRKDYKPQGSCGSGEHSLGCSCLGYDRLE